jgi:hypothetical protein
MGVLTHGIASLPGPELRPPVGQGAREGHAVTGQDGVPLDLVQPELHLALDDVDGLLAVVVVGALGTAARLDRVHVRLEQLGTEGLLRLCPGPRLRRPARRPDARSPPCSMLRIAATLKPRARGDAISCRSLTSPGLNHRYLPVRDGLISPEDSQARRVDGLTPASCAASAPRSRAVIVLLSPPG